MKDKRFSEMQEKLEDITAKIQNIRIQATAGNVANLYDAITNLQIVYNTLEMMRREQEDKGNDNDDGRETKAE